MARRGYLLLNFGGARDLKEVAPFLKELLCDRDLIPTGLPQWIHNLLFVPLAKWRARSLQKEYLLMGGSSPIYRDTQELAEQLAELLQASVWALHRYLPATHSALKRDFEEMAQCDELVVAPLFPQYSYATTGSCARWLKRNMPRALWRKLSWISSYPDHPAFIDAYAYQLKRWLKSRELSQQQLAVLVSFHGQPQSFQRRGDPYLDHCLRSYDALKAHLPNAVWHYSFQSKFGPGRWLEPYTLDCVQTPTSWCGGRDCVLILPLAFTSDHLETLVEVEQEYLPPLRAAGLEAYRLPALGSQEHWATAFARLIADFQPYQRLPGDWLLPPT